MNWQVIFDQSKANGAAYVGESLPYQIWQWPKDTWLQERRREVRAADKKESPWPLKTTAAVATANPVKAVPGLPSEPIEAQKPVVSDEIRRAMERRKSAAARSDQIRGDHSEYRDAA